MPRPRRPPRVVRAADHDREMLAAFGRTVRESRLHAGLTQRQLAAGAGVSESALRRVERGASATISVDTLQRIGYSLDRPVTMQLARGVAEPIDAGHLAMQELVVRLVSQAGYRPRVELPSVRHGTWRSSDVAAMRAPDRSLVGIECWNAIGDLGAGFRSSDRKRRDLEELAAATWGPGDHRVGICWVVRATRANRELVAKYPLVFASRFPGSSSAWVDALTKGAPPPMGDGLVWSDVGATRVFPWRRPGVTSATPDAARPAERRR
ncbi:MAG TPA: helix-turn-helix domain-containing protein [Patescibacteria group bacterium]|nr:helix-turn-helix domain-containing protein [Patescibacteria group bacterium]